MHLNDFKIIRESSHRKNASLMGSRGTYNRIIGSTVGLSYIFLFVSLISGRYSEDFELINRTSDKMRASYGSLEVFAIKKSFFL